jgi:hypothetical protein
VSRLCEFSDLPMSGCAHCRGIAEAGSMSDKVLVVAWFTAKYAGHCANCNAVFAKDEIIGVTNDPDLPGRYVCRECAM